jgi:hypothetical protein
VAAPSPDQLLHSLEADAAHLMPGMDEHEFPLPDDGV